MEPKARLISSSHKKPKLEKMRKPVDRGQANDNHCFQSDEEVKCGHFEGSRHTVWHNQMISADLGDLLLGVWGVGRSSSVSKGGVSDEDLQAQGWLPACLTCLLAQVWA